VNINNRQLTNRQNANIVSGFTLTELLGAIIVGGLILSVAGAGLGAILNASRQADVKNTRRQELSRALAYMNTEIKEGRTVTSVDVGGSDANCDTAIADTGSQCLKITKPSETIYYGFKDISGGTQEWFKPGIVKIRKVAATTVDGVLVDGLIASNPSSLPACSTTLKGLGGFRFCLGTNNRLVNLYLYGYTGVNSDPIAMRSQNFALSGQP
jgi:type II secretory pathway pseudopilin PulG